MAIPENRRSISTNLPFPRLEVFLNALKEETVQHVPGSTSMFAEFAQCEFDFEGARYYVDEFVEEVTSVRLISAKPSFVQTVIDELEAELSVAVSERDYDQAKEINEKIEDLKELLKV